MSRVARWGLIALAGVALLYLLFFHVFPWVERNLYTPTLGSEPAATDVHGEGV